MTLCKKSFNVSERSTCNGFFSSAFFQRACIFRAHDCITLFLYCNLRASCSGLAFAICPVSDSEFFCRAAAKFKQVQVCIGSGAESSSAHKTTNVCLHEDYFRCEARRRHGLILRFRVQSSSAPWTTLQTHTLQTHQWLQLVLQARHISALVFSHIHIT